jgi:hypothetical protein
MSRGRAIGDKEEQSGVREAMAMGTDKEDTDPSSPGALRPRTSGFAPTSAKSRSATVEATTKPTTDPGLGPRPSSDPPPPLSKGRSFGVVVPPPSERSAPNPNAITPSAFAPISRSLAAPPSLSKDSVELLLEGMTGPRPDRRKTTPQSDGEASAAYHAEHGLRPARSSSEPGPKVVVERPVPPAAPSRPRPVMTVPGRVSSNPLASREALSTFVPGRVLRRRVAMAILAGVLIVLLSFMALRLSEERHALGPVPATPDRPAVATATAEAPTPSEPVTGAAPVEPATPPPTATANPEPPAPAAAHASATGTTRHHHTASEAPSAAPTGDLGEFKARF